MGCDIHFFVEKFSDEPITKGPVDISEEREERLSTLLGEKKNRTKMDISR